MKSLHKHNPNRKWELLRDKKVNNTTTHGTWNVVPVKPLVEEFRDWRYGVKRVLMWSGGKDSTATGIVAKLNGLPIDRIVTVMPDPFRCELELLEKFQDWMGMRVEVVEGPKFEDFFFRVKVRGVNKGGIYGWPKIRQKACARMLKWMPQAEWHRKNPGHQAIVGIAADELRRMTGVQKMNDVSYLGMEGLTQADARSLCEQHKLLNPLYGHFARTGCVRCPKQCKAALEAVRELEPEKWAWMIKHDKISPVTFRPGKTLSQLMFNKLTPKAQLIEHNPNRKWELLRDKKVNNTGGEL